MLDSNSLLLDGVSCPPRILSSNPRDSTLKADLACSSQSRKARRRRSRRSDEINLFSLYKIIHSSPSPRARSRDPRRPPRESKVRPERMIRSRSGPCLPELLRIQYEVPSMRASRPSDGSGSNPLARRDWAWRPSTSPATFIAPVPSSPPLPHLHHVSRL